MNKKLMQETLAWIEANPSHWNQKKWHCGTTHCFAGVAEMLGQNLSPATEFSSEDTARVAQELLGLNVYQADYLFLSSNSLKTIWEVVTCATRGCIASRNIINALFKEDLAPELMAELADDGDYDVRRAIARREDLTPELTAKLADDEDSGVRWAIAHRKYLTPELMAKLTEDGDYDVRLAIAHRKYLTPELMAKLTEDGDYDVRRAIARREDLTPELMAKLAEDEHPGVRRAIASRKYLTPELITKLADDEHPYVRRAFA